MACAYGSLCAAVFMVKTMKRVIFQETRAYGEERGGRQGEGARVREREGGAGKRLCVF